MYKLAQRVSFLKAPSTFLMASSRCFSASPVKYNTILTDIKDNYAIITLNRPKQLNALCLELCTELGNELMRLDKVDEVRCVIVTGAGDRAFAAGADIKEMADKDYSDVFRDDMFEIWRNVYSSRKPKIAAVNGFALGGGCEVAMMCDIIIASDKAKFGQPEILLGTLPGMGATQRLTHAVGKSVAMELMLTGRQFTAEEAKNWGLVSRVIPHESLMEEAEKMAKQISSFSTPALMAAKECINRSFETSLSEGILFERRVFQGTFASHDRTEGMKAFVERRSPVWKHK